MASGNVFSWDQALRKGHQPRLYGYEPGDVPIGAVEAILDFKIWAQKVMGINGYFTDLHSGRKFQITVYLTREKTYRTGNSLINFYSCADQTVYQLLIERSKTGKVMLKDLVPVVKNI